MRVALVLAFILSFVAIIWTQLDDERDAPPETIDELELLNLVGRYGRERAARAVLAGLRLTEELTELVGRPVDGPSAVVWPTLRVSMYGVVGRAIGIEGRSEIYKRTTRSFFDNVLLDGYGLQPWNILAFISPNYFEMADYDERLQYFLSRDLERNAAEFLASTVPRPDGCGGRIRVDKKGHAEFAILLADPRKLTLDEIETCLTDGLLAVGGFVLRDAHKPFTPFERAMLGVATINAAYQCATDETLTSLTRPDLEADRTNALPDADCIVDEAVRLLSGAP